MNKNLIITILVAVVFAAAGFFGGMQYQKSQRGNFARQFGGNATNGQNQARRNFGGAVIGQILSSDDKSITVKMADGSSKIVILSDSTTYSKSDPGSKSDIKVGENVAVFGTANSDGSVTAQNVQLNPQFRNPGNPAASPNPTQ